MLVSGTFAGLSWLASRKSAKSADDARKAEKLREQMQAFRTIYKVYILAGGGYGEVIRRVNTEQKQSSTGTKITTRIGNIETTRDTNNWGGFKKGPLTGLTIKLSLYSDFLSSLLIYDDLFDPTPDNGSTKAKAMFKNFANHYKPSIDIGPEKVSFSEENRAHLVKDLTELVSDLEFFVQHNLKEHKGMIVRQGQQSKPTVAEK